MTFWYCGICQKPGGDDLLSGTEIDIFLDPRPKALFVCLACIQEIQHRRGQKCFAFHCRECA